MFFLTGAHDAADATDREAATNSVLKLRYLPGIPTQVVVPSVSCAAVLQGFAGTIFVATPSAAGFAKPVVDSAGCSAVPWTVAGATGGDD